MPYPAVELITNALYHSKIRSREFDTPSGADIEVGIDQLNKLIADKTLAIGEIPYYTNYGFDLAQGVENYFIPNLIDISTFTFFIQGVPGEMPPGTNQVRYSTGKQSRAQFFGSPRAVGIQSLPFNWHIERKLGGAQLYLYFVPNAPYFVDIWGLFSIPNVTLFQDLSLSFDLFYIDFLEFQLAQRLCNTYDFILPEGVQQELERKYKALDKQSGQLDTKVLKMTTLDSRNSTLNYADANLGHGWRP